jgi:hypothetical protein
LWLFIEAAVDLTASKFVVDYNRDKGALLNFKLPWWLALCAQKLESLACDWQAQVNIQEAQQLLDDTLNIQIQSTISSSIVSGQQAANRCASLVKINQDRLQLAKRHILTMFYAYLREYGKLIQV